jgi:hypothetical protein
MAQYGEGENSYLDDVRKSEGDERCRTVFGEACRSDIRRAASLLNDRRLTFGCLFLLSPLITQYRLDRFTNQRNRIALMIAGSPEAASFSDRDETARAALKWMLETGRTDDGTSDEYEEAMEVAASVLINTYRDSEALPAVIDMIFDRSRKGRNIHSLVWAAFQSRSPAALKLIAQRITSADQQEARLSCSLLGVEAPESGAAGDNQKRYAAYLQWLEENDPFLYFTGESFQYASRPKFYSVDLERKYISRGTPHYDRQPVSPADEGEREALAAFSTLDPNDKALLSDYSHRLHAKDASEWKEWVRRPIGEQVSSAKQSRESYHDYGFGSFV